MHVVTHLLAGWIIADESKLRGRDREIVAWACVIPDVDGVGLIIDATNNLLGRLDISYYETYHHYLAHGLFGAIITTVLAYSIAIEKRKTALLACLTYHLHLLMDLAGSRGSSPLDIWPINYLAPYSELMSFSWNGQWPLTSWQNTSLTVILMIVCFYTAIKRGYSPVMLFSNKADKTVIKTLQNRFN